MKNAITKTSTEARLHEILTYCPLTAGLQDNVATLHKMHLQDEDIRDLFCGKAVTIYDIIVNPSDGSSHSVSHITIHLETGKEEGATILLNGLEIEQFFSQIEDDKMLISDPERLLKENRELREENARMREHISVLQESIDAMKMLVDTYENS